MKKIIFFNLAFITFLSATTLNLNLAPSDPKRVTPNNISEILSFNDAIKDAMDSVVNISTKQHVKLRRKMSGLFNDPLLEQFFGPMFKYHIPKERLQRTLGSGVIITKDGYIITNNHVVENADEVVVTLAHDTKEFVARVVGRDKDSDLALIKIEAPNLKPIKIGKSSSLKIGDVVFAIGNPFGVGESVTQGIVSALNKNKVGINQYENFIQTDASINPGNSGGALTDSRGALIGINSVIVSRSGGNNGIGFAIPVDMAINIAKKLAKDGKVYRGFLGVSVSDLTNQLKSLYNHKNGAIVLNVEEDSPAKRATLQRGDLIYKVDNKEIKDAATLKQVIGEYKPNQKIRLSIERDRKNIELDIILDSRNMMFLSDKEEKIIDGLYLSELDRQKRLNYRIPSSLQGILIEDVKPESEAEKVGFQAGDIIIQIESVDIKHIKDIKIALKKYKNMPKRVYINRYGTILMIVI